MPKYLVGLVQMVVEIIVRAGTIGFTRLAVLKIVIVIEENKYNHNPRLYMTVSE